MYLPENITLGPGDRGEMVFRLQQVLHARGNYLGQNEFTGHYDGYTTTAVMRFQGDNRLRTDGIAGPETIRVLNGGRVENNNDELLATAAAAGSIYGTMAVGELLGDAIANGGVQPGDPITAPAIGAEVPPNMQQVQQLPQEMRAAPVTRDRVQQVQQNLAADVTMQQRPTTALQADVMAREGRLNDTQGLRDNPNAVAATAAASTARNQANLALQQDTQPQQQRPNTRELTPEALLRQPSQTGAVDSALQTRGPTLESDIKQRPQAIDSRQFADNLARQSGMGVSKDKEMPQPETGTRDVIEGKEGLRDRTDVKERDPVGDAVKGKQEAQQGTGKQEQDPTKNKSQNEVKQETLQKQALKDIEMEKTRDVKETRKEEKQAEKQAAKETEKKPEIVKEFDSKKDSVFAKMNEKTEEPTKENRQERKEEKREERAERKEEKQERREAERAANPEKVERQQARQEQREQVADLAQMARNNGVEYSGNVRAMPEMPSQVPNNVDREVGRGGPR